MPKIASVQVCIARVPLDNVTSIASRTIHDRHYALVKIQSVDGVEGIGFCYVGNTAGHLATVAVSELLAPILIGQEFHLHRGTLGANVSRILATGTSGHCDACNKYSRHCTLGSQCPYRKNASVQFHGVLDQ